MRKVLLDVFYSVQTRGFWVAVFLSAAAFMEAVLAEGEGDLLYLYTMSMSFGIFTVAASCIAVLPTVRELSSYKGSILKYNLLRSGTSRYIVGKAISISIIGGLALMLGPAISLIVLSFKNPLVSEAFLDIYALEPELNASFSNLVRAQQYQLFLAIKLLMVFMYGFSINMIAFAVSTCAKESFVIALAPFLILQSATNLLNSAGTAYVKPATYLHGYLLRVPFDNTLGFFGVILLTHVVIFGICLTASIYIIGRRLKYA